MPICFIRAYVLEYGDLSDILVMCGSKRPEAYTENFEEVTCKGCILESNLRIAWAYSSS